MHNHRIGVTEILFWNTEEGMGGIPYISNSKTFSMQYVIEKLSGSWYFFQLISFKRIYLIFTKFKIFKKLTALKTQW